MPFTNYIYLLVSLFLLETSILKTSIASNEIQAVLFHPIFNEYYSCAEHWDGQFKEVGDALGTDCFIQKMEERDGKSWMRSFAKDGLANQDWYAWNKDVLSPIDGKIIKININSDTNQPGVMGKGMASYVVIERDDGIKAMVAHLDRLKVKVNDRVKAGQVIARVGNNGQSRQPHIHVGAWREKEPMQIRFDQRKIRGL